MEIPRDPDKAKRDSSSVRCRGLSTICHLKQNHNFPKSSRVPTSRTALPRVDKASHSHPLPHRAPASRRSLRVRHPEREREVERPGVQRGVNEERPSRTENHRSSVSGLSDTEAGSRKRGTSPLHGNDPPTRQPGGARRSRG